MTDSGNVHKMPRFVQYRQGVVPEHLIFLPRQGLHLIRCEVQEIGQWWQMDLRCRGPGSFYRWYS